MKVLFINSVCGIRSTGRICADIADVLISEGHECKIAYGRESVPNKYKDIAVRIGGNFGVKIHGIKARLFDSSGFGSYFATKKFIKFVKEYDPDVIHLHNIHGYYLHVGVLFDYLKTCGKRIIWTLHDCWAYTGHCSYYQAPRCDKWTSACDDKCVRKGDYPKSFTSRAKSNFFKKKSLFCGVPNMTLVTPSKWLADEVKRSFLGEYPIEVINNGIDLSVFKPTESDFRERYGLVDKKIILGVASVWEKRKGLDDFLELARILPDEYRIVLIGVNDKQIKSLPHNVVGIRRTNDTTELAGIYTTADVLFNPTYEDNYPSVNLEAQACGTPVITYQTGGSIESVPEENVIDCMGDFVDSLIDIDKFIVQNEGFEKNKKYQTYLELYSLN